MGTQDSLGVPASPSRDPLQPAVSATPANADALQSAGRLSKSQPLKVNLRQLATNPDAALRAYGAEWAGWCAASALDALAEAERKQHTWDIDSAARKLAEVFDYPWEQMPAQGRQQMRDNAIAILAVGTRI